MPRQLGPGTPILHLAGADYRPFPKWITLKYYKVDSHWPRDIECPNCQYVWKEVMTNGLRCPKCDGN